jgi:hypothetical protein
VPLPQGLFERHKLIVATQLCMAVLRSKGELQRTKFEFLLRGPREQGGDNPVGDWVSTAYARAELRLFGAAIGLLRPRWSCTAWLLPFHPHPLHCMLLA